MRVVQNKEPDHFLLIFKGKMVVHAGGRASGFKNRWVWLRGRREVSHDP